jgi:hypothetical protein
VSYARAVDERNLAGSRPLVAEGKEEEAAIDANDVPNDVDVEDPTRSFETDAGSRSASSRVRAIVLRC